LGLVCFRLKGSNEVNECLLKSITKEGLIFMVPGKINDVFYIRFAICASSTETRHIDFAQNIISKHADIILNEAN
jgi:aromatic-L-amino-acid decarboxylase